MRVDPALACKHVEVAFECAPFCTDKTLVLHKTQLNNGYDEFCGQTSFASAGVRFYYLRLICHDKQSVHRESVLVAKKGEKSQAVLNEYRDMWQLTVYEKDFCTPAWSHGATAYQIFPDRFFASKLPDNTLYPERIVQTDKTAAPFWDVEKDSPTPITMDYFGGDLQGILQKLSYLKSLGVTLL